MTKVHIGDVIRSPKFAHGGYGTEWQNGDLVLLKKHVAVRSSPFGGGGGPVHWTRRETNGDWKRDVPMVTDTNADDPSRGQAKFVVERTAMDGGGTGHGPGDIYPNGWHVHARRLREDDTYDPEGEVIEFYQSGSFNCMVEDPEIVGKMKMRFEVEIDAGHPVKGTPI